MENNVKATFLIGEEWLYYKIYTGFATTDSVLYNHLYTVVTGLLRDGVIDKWFFIRYADPEHHLRLRLHLTEPEHIGLVILAFRDTFRRLSDQHTIWKIQTETYERELSRYGEMVMEETETLFFYDSECMVKLLTVLELTDNDNERWMVGMAAIDSFLSVFEYDMMARKKLTEHLRTGFFKEFQVNAMTKKDLSTKYRNHKNEIDRFMKSNPDSNDLKALLLERNQIILTAANGIREALEPERLDDVLGSHIHMMMNRLFDSNNRQCEMILYDLLCSYYTSVLAREKKAQLTISG
jgi:hypothetical protein